MILLNKYIDWSSLWCDEVFFDNSHDDFCDIIKQFESDNDVELCVNECHLDSDRIVFCFSETGGQNESDTQGWSRCYWFVFDYDMLLIDAGYEQG